MSDLPYSDPSNPALPSPLFSDLTAVRGDHMRANNAAIFADLLALNERNPELVALTGGSFKTAALANANTYNGRSFFTCTAGVSDTPSAGAWRIFGFWNPSDSSGRFVAMADATLETWEINYSGAAWGTWTRRGDVVGPESSVNADIALFDGITGKLIKDSGYSISNLLSSKVFGLTLSNAADADHDITMAVGKCADSTLTIPIVLSSAMTKQLDAAWAAGTNAGGLFSGSIAPNTWYAVHLIRKDSDGSIDFGFDTSETAAHRPAGYTYYRRVGWIPTDASSNIRAFIQNGNFFTLSVPVKDLGAASLGTSAVSLVITSAPGCIAIIHAETAVTAAGGPYYYLLTDLDQANTAPSSSCFSLVGISGAWNGSDILIKTNSSSQIRYRISATGASIYLHIITRGWIDQAI